MSRDSCTIQAYMQASQYNRGLPDIQVFKSKLFSSYILITSWLVRLVGSTTSTHAQGCMYRAVRMYPEYCGSGIHCHRHWTSRGHSCLQFSLVACSNQYNPRDISQGLSSGEVARGLLLYTSGREQWHSEYSM